VIFRPELFIPELVQLAILAVLFIQTVGAKKLSSKVAWLPWAATAGAVVAALSMSQQGTIFYGAYQVDALSQFFKLAIAVGFAITCFNAVPRTSVMEENRADYFLFLGASAFGLMMLASSVELITIFLALEISSYSLYALIPQRGRETAAAEAGVKYILFGAVVTALAMYGLSYILATQHTTYLAELATRSWSWADSPVAVVGLALFMAAMLYKLALFPLHFWVPDVYQGASNETAAFAATLPKLGAVVILVRLAVFLEPGLEVTTFLAVLAALSMTIGNLSALVQNDLKRMLGYSTVAHAGIIMLGVVSGTPEGMAAAIFYSFAYLLMNLTCFWVICRLSHDGRNLTYNDLNGLYRRSPALAMTLAVAAFALVGLPPTAGFMGKLFLLNAAWAQGYQWLVIIAVLNTAIAIFYYLNMVRHAYTQEQEEGAVIAALSPSGVALGGVMAVALLWLGIAPATIFELARVAGQTLFP
jgi:proton-translocating NADH-quinone oxidoreductase chain N